MFILHIVTLSVNLSGNSSVSVLDEASLHSPLHLMSHFHEAPLRLHSQGVRQVNSRDDD